MRKLLLVLFLCSLTSNALAKQFIMKCIDVNDRSDIKVFKINTEIPSIFNDIIIQSYKDKNSGVKLYILNSKY